ncbi:hypothetical protein V5O48_012802 [Marasmius crinis-equi]|uniref:Uncharacterized protein n=1 Tax=Marasmius crinis-equi TaxID=585013 RepID=A0ABR3F1V2_9AGAR
MLRAKLYYTKVQRREANRVKNRRFYDNHFEQRLQYLSDVYSQQVKPTPRAFLNKLCQQTLRWKKQTHSPIAPRKTTMAPVSIDREAFQTMLDEHQRLSKEYFVLFEGEGWADWNDRWDSLTALEDVLATMIETLALIEVELEMEEMPNFNDLTLIYDTVYPETPISAGTDIVR